MNASAPPWPLDDRRPREARRIVANLDAELEWREIGTGRKPRHLPAAARDAAAAYGTLLRAFALPGDRLELVDRIDPARIVSCPPLPGAELLDASPGGDTASTVTWGWSRHGGSGDPEVAARAADRAALHAVLADADLALPGSRTHATADGLRRHLVEPPPVAGPAPGHDADVRAWVVKGRWSAAGRDRVWVPPAIAGEGHGPAHRAAERLLVEHGAVVVEPWVSRVDDHAVAAPSPRALAATRPHRLDVDARGGFVGVRLGSGPDLMDGLLAPDARARRDAGLGTVAAWLDRIGYDGPVGVDGFRYRDADGAIRLHPVVEVNPRFTFGHVARALAIRLAGWDPDGGPGRAVRLGLGPRAFPDPADIAGDDAGDGHRRWPLLLSPDHTRVWAALDTREADSSGTATHT